MYNSKISFFSILLLIVFHIHELRGMYDMVPLVLDRTPSTAIDTEGDAVTPAYTKAMGPEETIRRKYPEAKVYITYYRSAPQSLNMKDFLRHIITTMKNPCYDKKPVCLDFNTSLLGIIARLKKASTEDQTRWALYTKPLLNEIASQHTIAGIKMNVPCDPNSQEIRWFIHFIVDPFNATGNLRLLELTRIGS